MSTAEISGRPEQNQDLRCQSGPSDKVQDRDMYLFAISYGSDAMDQEVELVDSVDELRSSSSNRGNFNAEFRST